jgi:hypothetical protein
MSIATLAPIAEKAKDAREVLSQEIDTFVESLSSAFGLKSTRYSEIEITDGWFLSRNAENWKINKELRGGRVLEISNKSKPLAIMQHFVRALTPDLIEGLEFTFMEMAHRLGTGSKLLREVSERLNGTSALIQEDSIGNVTLLVRMPRAQQLTLLHKILKTNTHSARTIVGSQGVDLKLIFPTTTTKVKR